MKRRKCMIHLGLEGRRYEIGYKKYSNPPKLRRRWFLDRRRYLRWRKSIQIFTLTLFQNGEDGSRPSISTKDRDTFILWKIYTKHEIMKKRLSAWGYISSWTVGRISESSPVLTNTGGEAWDFEDNVNKPILEAWRNKGLFYTFSISSQQANILIFPSPVISVHCSFPQ